MGGPVWGCGRHECDPGGSAPAWVTSHTCTGGTGGMRARGHTRCVGHTHVQERELTPGARAWSGQGCAPWPV